jgi:hypothetical protein
MSAQTCVLSDQEVLIFRSKGDCSQHGHIKASEAAARISGSYPRAEQVGDRAIRMFGPRKPTNPWHRRRCGPRSLFGGPEFKTWQLFG